MSVEPPAISDSIAEYIGRVSHIPCCWFPLLVVGDFPFVVFVPHHPVRAAGHRPIPVVQLTPILSPPGLRKLPLFKQIILLRIPFFAKNPEPDALVLKQQAGTLARKPCLNMLCLRFSEMFRESPLLVCCSDLLYPAATLCLWWHSRKCPHLHLG